MNPRLNPAQPALPKPMSEVHEGQLLQERLVKELRSVLKTRKGQQIAELDRILALVDDRSEK